MSREQADTPVNVGEQRWAFKTNGGITSSPTVVDGTVYVGSDDCHLYAFDATTGSPQWRFDIGSAVKTSPTVVDDTVYIGGAGGTLFAVAADDGIKQWTFETGAELFSSPAVSDGTVYVGSWDKNLYAVDSATGTEQWVFETGGEIDSSPVVVDGTVYVGSWDKNLYAVDSATGTEQWAFETGGYVDSPIVVDGTVYVGNNGRKNNNSCLYAVDAAIGIEQWKFETGSAVATSPTVVEDTVYVPTDGGTVYAVAADDGTQHWSYETGSYVHSSPAVVGGTVYVGSADSHLYAIAADDGTEQWTFETGFGISSSPTVVDGTVYVGSIDNHLYAVAVSTRQGDAGNEYKKATNATAVSLSNGSPADRKPLHDPADAPIPKPETVTSPPRREDLSYETMTVVDQLGVGGQALINKARLAEGPPEVVAIREPDTSATLTNEAVDQFLSHAETWSIIDTRERKKRRWDSYEHVVGVVATGDRQPWLALEYMDGGDLGELLAEHPDGLSTVQALWYGECVCKGLEIAHNLGRAHLDVKPENILLKETDGWPWPKIADWGLARTLADETGTMEGLSVQYAAPEQFDSTAFGDPDQLTDIYQTGALVYGLLTGVPPATGSQLEVMQTVIGEEPIAPPSDHRPELSATVDAAVGLALERDKTDRYSSISNFAEALNAVRTGRRLPTAVAARMDG